MTMAAEIVEGKIVTLEPGKEAVPDPPMEDVKPIIEADHVQLEIKVPDVIVKPDTKANEGELLINH